MRSDKGVTRMSCLPSAKRHSRLHQNNKKDAFLLGKEGEGKPSVTKIHNNKRKEEQILLSFQMNTDELQSTCQYWSWFSIFLCVLFRSSQKSKKQKAKNIKKKIVKSLLKVLRLVLGLRRIEGNVVGSAFFFFLGGGKGERGEQIIIIFKTGSSSPRTTRALRFGFS